MNLKWLGTASIVLEHNGHKILFDPYLKKLNPALPEIDMDALTDVEAIFITHPHFDHFSDIPVFLGKCSCPVYVGSRGYEIAKSLGWDLDAIKPIDAGDAVQIGDLRIQAWQGDHVTFDKKLERQTLCRILKTRMLRQAKEIGVLSQQFSMDPSDTLCFSVRTEEMHIFLMGSAAIAPSVSYPNDIDLLVYPYQGRSDMCRYSVELIEKLNPRKVLLDHFDDAFPPISSELNGQELKQLLKIPVIIPKEMECVRMTKRESVL